MLKKAETVCSVVNTDGIVTATFTHTRGFPIESFSYDVQKETGLPFIIGDNSLVHDGTGLYKDRFEIIKEEESTPLPFINPSDAFDNPLDTIPF
jgi:hypothetical protein